MSDPIADNRDRPSSALATATPFRFSLRSSFIATAVVAALVAGTKAAGFPGAYLAGLCLCFVTWIWSDVTRRRRLSIISSRFFVFGSLIAFFAALLWPAHQGSGYSRRSHCLNNLKQLGIAVRNYENQHGNFPPVRTLDENGKPLMSWRTSMMPHLEHAGLHAHYRTDEPWNSPANKLLAQTQLELLKCPSNPAVAGNNLTSYVAIISPGGAWIPGHGLQRSEIKDDLRDTILLVEMRDSNIAWAEPRDLDLSNLPPGITTQNLLESLANHPGIVNVFFADGSLYAIPTTIPWQDFLAMLTIAGGETIDRSKW